MKKQLTTLLLAIIATTSFAQYREVILPQKPQTTNFKDYDEEVTPFWFGVDAEYGLSIMEEKRNMQFGEFTVTGGYRLSQFLRVGAGFGARNYTKNADERNTNSKFGIPLFLNARGNFLDAYDRDGVPFWSVNIGTITHEGLYFNPTIGYSFGGLRNNLLVGLSYSLSTFKNFEKKDRAYSYLGIKIGYEF